mgnify:CR=1
MATSTKVRPVVRCVVQLRPETWEWVEREAERRGVSRSQVVRDMMDCGRHEYASWQERQERLHAASGAER